MTGEPYPLFLIWPTHDYRLLLRRFRWKKREDMEGVSSPFHEKNVVVETFTRPEHTDYDDVIRQATDEETLDPRWPTVADDGYVFTPDDPYWRREERLWTSDGDNRFPYNEAPIGACFEASRDKASQRYLFVMACDEYKAVESQRGTYHVMLPCRAWFTPDRVASNSASGTSGWTVTGTLPNITVSPSISHLPGQPEGYHGWLGVDGTPVGHLSRDLDGRDC